MFGKYVKKWKKEFLGDFCVLVWIGVIWMLLVKKIIIKEKKMNINKIKCMFFCLWF